MARSFEVFTGRAKPVSSKVMRAGLNKKGAFSLNHAAYTAIGEPKLVELLYDRENRVIGIRGTEETTRHAYPVRRQKDSHSYLIASQAFTKYYEIELPSTLSFEPEVEDEILILDLNKATQIPPRQYRRSGKEKQEKEKEKQPSLVGV